MADCAHFPIQDTNDSRLCLVKYHIVDLVVAVDECCAVLGLRGCVGEKGDHVVLMGDFADGLEIELKVAIWRL
jgi:hypothetical protein